MTLVKLIGQNMRANKITTRAWVWRSMVKTGIIPLILVESVLIAAYLLSNHFINRDNMQYIRTQVDEELKISALRESGVIREKLKSVAGMTMLYRNETARVLQEPLSNSTEEQANLAVSESGVMYSKQNLGGAASFYSAHTENKDWDKVGKLSRLDPLMKQLVDNNDLVASVYFNSWDSYNRIYPWFNTLEQYPTDMVIPDYNFYYLADSQHNPEQNNVWTDVYIDPAGNGWMASSIAPVYNNNVLEGVVGLDITVSAIVDSIQSLAVPWGGYAVLASANGTIMALPPQGEQDFGLKELTDYSYQQAITEEIFKPEAFNLMKREDTAALSQSLLQSVDGLMQVQLDNANKLVAWSTIPETQWRLLLIVDENKMYAASRQLEQKYQNIGYLMIAGLVAFYTLFLIFIWTSSKKMSNFIAEPLSQIQDMVHRASIGDFKLSHDGFRLKELNETANEIILMGEELDTLTAELKHAKLEAEKANVAKSQFISNVSHEVRTPMNSILGLSHVLLNSNLSDEHKSHLLKIDKSAKHLLSLINDILDLSKLDAGKVDIEYIPFEVEPLIQDVYDLFDYKASMRGISFVASVESDIPVLVGDPLRIKQILLNYVSNAIKFTEEGGIALNVELLSQSNDKARIQFSVADTGIGLSFDEQAKIFESYQQADASTTRKYGGTGLGLTICKRIAALMGGTVEVESECGIGSTFLFTIELSIDHSGVRAPARNKEVSESDSVHQVHQVMECNAENLQEFEQRVLQLEVLLKESDLESEHFYSQHQHCFEQLSPELNGKLLDAVSSYDFDRALALIEQVKDKINEHKDAAA